MASQVREPTQVNKKQPGGEKTVTQVSSPVLHTALQGAVPAQEGMKRVEGEWRDGAAGADATAQMFTSQTQKGAEMMGKGV